MINLGESGGGREHRKPLIEHNRRVAESHEIMKVMRVICVLIKL